MLTAIARRIATRPVVVLPVDVLDFTIPPFVVATALSCTAVA